MTAPRFRGILKWRWNSRGFTVYFNLLAETNCSSAFDGLYLIRLWCITMNIGNSIYKLKENAKKRSNIAVKNVEFRFFFNIYSHLFAAVLVHYRLNNSIHFNKIKLTNFQFYYNSLSIKNYKMFSELILMYL